ncbi:ABC transporter permease [Pseudactinotalea sp. Z1732]|uniref:ABC transporter permease n=1 Tax=Micrococcales TaxID=85006 RepID=UPI003C79ECB6
MTAAIRTEALKLFRSAVGVLGTIALVGGVLVLVAGLTTAVRAGNAQVIAQAGPGAQLDWAGMLAMSMQITAAGALLGCGVVLTWLVGREFSDGTISALFALPVSVGRIVLGKIAVYGLWVVAVHLALAAGLLALGLLLGYGVPDAGGWAGLLRLFVLGLLTGAIAMPVAWVATLTRSVLAGVGATIGLVALAQVGVLAGAGGWFPLAAPALWAMSGSGTPAVGIAPGTSVTGVHLLIVVMTSVFFALLLWRSWSRLQMDH